MSTRTETTSKRHHTFDPSGIDMDTLPDHEVERLLFADEPDETSGFWTMPTLAGTSLIGVGLVYLLGEMGLPVLDGLDLTVLVEMLPILAGVLVVLIGMGVISERSPKKTTAAARPARGSAFENDPADEDEGTGGFFGGNLFGGGLFEAGQQTITRSRRDRKLAGVCGGFADYLNLDSTLLRIAFVIGLFATSGHLALAYFLLIFAIPKNEKPQRFRVVRD